MRFLLIGRKIPTDPVKNLFGQEKRPASLQAFGILAPRPGLEPGTCGLTEQGTSDIIADNLKIS